MKLLKTLPYSVFLIFLLSLLSCQQEENTAENRDDFTLKLRIDQEPEALFPFYSTSSNASKVEKLMYQSLMEIDPQTLELRPVLAAKSPKKTISNDTFTYDFQLRKEAEWGNGEKLTTEDVEFTVKLVLVPGFDKSGIRSYLSNLIELEPTTENSFSVSFKGRPFLSEEAISTLAIIPESVYDSSEVLEKYAVDELVKMEKPDSILNSFTQSIDQVIHSDQLYVGSNAYEFKQWEKQQGIVLERKENWWADKLSDKEAQFNAFPSQVEFAIIPDDGTALSAFKNNQIDVLTDVEARDFKNLKGNENDYKYFTTTPFSFYYLCLNNKDEFLKDRALRRALAYCFDVDKFIQLQMDSMGVKVHSPIHPSSQYFLEDSSTLAFSLDKAENILKKNGYRDKNKDDILENPEGKTVKLNILISGGELGKTMALLLKQNAAKIGLDITIETMKFSGIRKRLFMKNYQMTPLALSTNPFKYDPYQSWHSDNASVEGSNYSGFSDSLADEYIETIRTAESDSERMNAYKGFQRRIQGEIPVIFVAAPVRCIVVQNDLEVPITPLSYSIDIMRAEKVKKE